MSDLPEKVLVVRFSSMGDIILTSSVVRCLKKQVNCEIHYIIKEQFKNLVEGNPYIDKIWTIESAVSELKDELRNEKYDAVVDLHKSLRSWHLTWLLKKGAYRLNKLNIRKWLFVNFKVNLLPDKHIVDRYMETLEQWNVTNDGKGLDYFIQTESLEIADSFLSDTEESIAVVLGAAHFTKVPPFRLLYELCENYEGKISLIGGPAEQEKGEKLVSMTGGKVKNFAGKLSIDESAYVLNKSSMVIAPDTGMMHISAALQKPIILLWGSTHPAFGMYPYYGKSGMDYQSVAVENLSCRPCTKMGRSSCPEEHFLCMKQHRIEDILRKIDIVKENSL